MTDPAAARVFLLGEVEGLAPFGFVAAGISGEPLCVAEVARRENGGLEVRVPGRPPIIPELPAPVRQGLAERGFASRNPEDRTEPWVCEAASADAAVELLQRVLTEVFGAKSDANLDVRQGSHQAEHEARVKLEGVRERIEKLVADWMGSRPETDQDGDYLIPVQDVRVTISPRVAPGGGVVVRIFAITNVGVTVAPELGLFLARLNFRLMFGRFALDAEHHSIWVDETLLGDHFTDDEFRFTVGVVASIADEWDDRLKQMFGGATYQDVVTERSTSEAPPTKPGQGGYL